MKLPNGYGSIIKLSKGRRHKYGVIVTSGWNSDGKQIRKYIGYVDNYQDGLQLLAKYHNEPYDLDYKNLTFADIWNKSVLKKLENQVKDGKMSQNNIDALSFAYNNHCKPLYKYKITELKLKIMQDVIDNATNSFNNGELGYTAKGFIKTVCVKIFDSAINDYELPISNNTAAKLAVGAKPKSDKHSPFTDKEISIIWGMQYNDGIKALLIFLYTGLRPNELFITKKENINLDENYFITGSKTEAGKSRMIPIHPKIKHIIKYFYDKDTEFPFKTIYEKFNYGKYKREFNKLMEQLKMDHTPYDGRHTFITKMKKANADEYILKRIVGHSINDITERVYTHRSIMDLYNEIIKIN